MGGKPPKRPIVFYVLGRDKRDPLLPGEPLGPLAEPASHPEQEPEADSTYDSRSGKIKKPRGYFLNRYIY